MANQPLLSLRHILVLSLALNVSLILRIVYDSGDEVHRLKKTMIPDSGIKTEKHVVQISRLTVSSSSGSSLLNSTGPDRTGDKERVINLDQGLRLTSSYCALLPAHIPGEDRDNSVSNVIFLR